jgi:hypothetical protein
MGRFIVRYRGKGPAPAAAVERAGCAPGMRVVDQTARTLLVEGTPEAVQAVFAGNDEWLVTAERLYEIPDPRPRVQKKRGSARKGKSP